ncbi:MAG: biotin--[acetyl-CoA-carboxylase] ligase [Desulfobacteraceae bacterium]
MEPLSSDIINNFLGNSLFSNNITVHHCLESTNNTAKELYDQGAGDGTVILAEEQTAGRGRMERQWLSPAYKNILVSILLKPEMKVENIYSLTLALAVAGIDAIKSVNGLSGSIKWPNDIYLNNKKLAGILTEFRARGKSPDYVILGMGLNVNWNPEKEKNILFPSTSIYNETGNVTSRNQLVAEILRTFETLYDDIVNERLEEFNNRCNQLSLLTGKDVSVDTGEEKIGGKVLGIDKDGGLLLEGKYGNIKKILNGDVSISF